MHTSDLPLLFHCLSDLPTMTFHPDLSLEKGRNRTAATGSTPSVAPPQDTQSEQTRSAAKLAAHHLDLPCSHTCQLWSMGVALVDPQRSVPGKTGIIQGGLDRMSLAS